MAEQWTLEWIVTHPLSVLTAIVATAGSLFHLPLVDPLLGLAWNNAGALLAVSTVTAGQIAPRIPWLQPFIPTLQLAVLITAILFAATKLTTLARKARERFSSEGDST